MRLPKLILAGGLLVVLAAYSMGWSGTLHFDDEANLNGLHGISDFASGLQFVFSGQAGPTGRPLSLGTFALQHESWPDPKPFLIFNSVLHILNGVLCFLLLRHLLGWILEDRRGAEWLAVIVTVVWAASPFLASSNLVVVQRMTGLSAFFALLALNIYTIARMRYRPDSWRSNLWLASIAGTGTVMAGLAKENGFLLPVFLVLIEWLLVSNARITIKPLQKGFFWVVLMAPMGLILGFLLTRGLSAGGYLYRDFTLSERLLTQPRALFDYIRNLLIPATESITPFHDAYAYSTGLFTPVTTILAVAGLVVLIGFAWAVRRRWPVVAFGILFFLGGHLVESTVVSLELYFPHRNYLPAVGFYLAVVVGVYYLFSRFKVVRWLRFAFSGGYVLSFLYVLGLGTSLWGNRLMAAEVWHIHNRESVRAALYLYSFYQDENDFSVARQLNQRFQKQHPENALFALQALGLCEQDSAAYSEKVENAITALENEQYLRVKHVQPIQQLSAKPSEPLCDHMNVDAMERLINAALKGKDKVIHPRALLSLYFSQAQIHHFRGAYAKAIESLRESLDISPRLDTVLEIVYLYKKDGQEELAIDYLKQIIANPPVKLPTSIVWHGKLRDRLEELAEDNAGS